MLSMIKDFCISIYKTIKSTLESVVDTIYVPLQNRLQSWFTNVLPDNVFGCFCGAFSAYIAVYFSGVVVCHFSLVLSPVLGSMAVIVHYICYYWMIIKNQIAQYRALGKAALKVSYDAV